ncbi:Hpt domain-containing protein [Sulfitobacter guttiformis]|uniref:Hpt domain-containing protein n=1 Tax=Sulfitobacter guttiformis TaxID=74349 RepID=A0A420DTQ0_9RHOB|nr:Hpt domain-containing protein [Sulfitobacter guttiformis]KIN71075.1 hypothetical protein Z949_231 [Sulfitobacter guttiformis KCTC 32187]RKE97558.1 Hpt domain-containing protein [Sulfitobacter guttiformis]
MKDMPSELPGLERIKERFLSLLAERQTTIAHHALAAWESDSAAAQSSNLQGAQNVLHQIAGSAGSLGFVELGEAARSCEGAIITFLDSNDGAQGSLPHSLFEELDDFVCMSQTLLAQRS